MADGFQPITVAQIQTPDGIAQLNNIIQTLYNNMAGDGVNVSTFYGIGSPEGVVTAGIGSIYLRTDGGTNTSLYRKESGIANTGWVATSSVTVPISTANGGLGANASAWTSGDVIYLSGTGSISHQPLSSFNTYSAGSYLIIGPTALVQKLGSSYIKAVEVIVPRGGTLRTLFGLVNGTTAAGNIYGRIYRNGAAVGTERSQAFNAAYTEYSEDISGWTAGDLLQLYVKNDNASGQSARGGNLRLYENAPAKEVISVGSGPTIWTSDDTPTAIGLNSLGSIGDLYTNTAGGASTTLYVKTGASTWTAK